MKKLLDNEESINALFRFATEGIIITDDKGYIVRINPFAEKMFGYEQDELLGKSIEVLVPSRFTKTHTEERNTYYRNPYVRHRESDSEIYGLQKNQCEFPLEIALSPFTNSTGKFVIAFVVDVTIRKKAEEQLRDYSLTLEKEVASRTETLQKTVEELEQTKQELRIALDKERELNELKSRFVSTASHEFRTPLTTMQSSIALANKYCQLSDHQNVLKHMNKIKKSIYEVSGILDDFLTLTKLDENHKTNNPVTLNLKTFINDFITEIDHLFSEEQVCNQLFVGTEIVEIDETILKNILFNLISNSLKYSTKKATIEILTIVSDLQINITIKDNGIGIPEDDKKHLFSRFFRGSNASNIKGTGLGLSIVARYLDMLQGSISFDSVENEGTSFMITLPR